MIRNANLIGLVIVLLGALACASPPAQSAASIRLFEPQRGPVTLDPWLRQNRYTVVLFVSASCPCVHAHAERVRALSVRYSPLGVQFVAVDPERDVTSEIAQAERAQHGWSFPLLLDPDGQLADRLGAEYAGYAAVLDARGAIQYRGGIDSDRKALHDDAQPYLANALDDLLAGRAVSVPRTEALGCVLRRDGS